MTELTSLPALPAGSISLAVTLAVVPGVGGAQDVAYKAALPGSTSLSTVATTGNYADLLNRPDLSGYATTSSVTATLGSYLTAASAAATYATPAQVDARVQQVVGAAPAALDTLAEIATQLASDESAVASLTTTVAGKLAKSANLSDVANAATARTNLGLATVAATGNYADLSNKPTIPTAGTTAGTYAAGNDTRITGAYAASNPAGYVTAAQAASAAPVQSVAGLTGAPTATQVQAALGLASGAYAAAPTAGTTSGTFAAGNDPRIVNALTTLPSPRRLGATPTWVPVGTRLMGMPGTGTADTSNTSWNSAALLTGLPNASITALKLLYPGFDLVEGPRDRLQTLTGSASVYIPLGAAATTSQAAANGAATLFITQGSYNSSHTSIAAGMMVTGTGVPADTFVSATTLYPTAAKSGQFSVTLSNPITQALGAGSALTFVSAPFSFALANNAASGTTTLVASNVTGLAATNLTVGASLSGAGIASGTYVTAIAFASNGQATITLSAATTAAINGGTSLTATGLLTPVTFGGSKGFTLPPFQGVMGSDTIGVQIPPNAPFVVKTHIEAPGNASSLGGLQMANVLSATGQVHEGAVGSTTIMDLTRNMLDPTSNNNDGFWGPCAILGLPSVPLPAVLVVGDSIAAGIGDGDPLTGVFNHTGWPSKSLSNLIPWMIEARGGISATQILANPRGMVASAAQANVTDVVLALGTNDIQNNITASKLAAVIRQIGLLFASSGARVWVTTILPIVNGDNGTIAYQTPRATTYNTTLTAAAAVGDTVLQVQGNVGANSGAVVFGTTIAQFTLPVIQSSTATTVTLTAPLTAAIANGATVGFTYAEGQREAYNAMVRTQAVSGWGFAGVIDIASALESPTYGGRVRPNSPAFIPDGLHPSADGVAAIVASGVMDPAKFYAVFK